MAQSPVKTFRKPAVVTGPTATLLIANVQVICPRCGDVIGTEQGCAHWSGGLYDRFAGASCGGCGIFVAFPPLPGKAGRLDPRDVAKGLKGEDEELS